MSVKYTIKKSINNKQNQQINTTQWQEYVNQHKLSTIFHTPYMYALYEQCDKLTSFAYVALDHEGSIKALISGYYQDLLNIPLIKNFKRAVMMQSPLFSEIEALNELLVYYKNDQRDVIYTEIRNHYLNDEIKWIMNDLNFVFEEHLNIFINLNQSVEDMWKRIHPKGRNKILKAQKLGIQVKMINENELECAYNILKDVYSRIKLPILPISFFKKALSDQTDSSSLDIWGAYLNNQIIGMRVVLRYKQQIYDYYAGSLSSEYDKHPNDIIPWEIFKYYQKGGYLQFDFGGAGKPNIPYGVRDYKLKFGGELVNHGRYLFIHQQIFFLLLKLALKFRSIYLQWRNK